MSPLAHALVQPAGAPPARWAAFLHGIYGQGGNLRTLARRALELAPGWGVVLVDLRMHGRSQGFSPPHTVEAAAQDLRALEPHLPGPLAVVLGHSFGGKVTLAYAAARGDELAAAVIVDATPSSRPGGRGSETVLEVLEVLESLPAVLPTREAFLEIVQSAGITEGLAGWLAMNLARDGESYRLRLELPAIRALLDDYWAVDLWPVVERSPARTRIDLVVGGRSRVLDDADRARAHAAAARDPRVRVTVLPDAGHWVHVDAPEELARIAADALIASYSP